MATNRDDIPRLSDPNFDKIHVPDLIDAVEGWRCWKVRAKAPPYGLPPKLYSVVGGYFWVARRASVARCEFGCQKPRPPYAADMVPGECCSCGFHSVKTLEDLLSPAYSGYRRYSLDSGWVVVIGQVANWGNVIEGMHGWKASHSYPQRFYVPYSVISELGNALETAYGKPVSPLNWEKPRKSRKAA